MTNFEKLTQSPAEFGAFLRGLPILEGPWDDEFHKRYHVPIEAKYYEQTEV